MKNKQVIIIANFFENNKTSRPYVAYDYFRQKGYQVKVYYALFSHSLKKNRLIEGEDFHPISITTYSSNISISRIISHAHFAYKAYKKLREESPDIVYFNMPPNLLGLPLCWLRKRKGFKLIADVLDIWPEAFPFPASLKWIFNLSFGLILKQTREYVLNNADAIMTESAYFSDKMRLNRFPLSKVIHLKKITPLIGVDTFQTSEELSICYIGNIGMIYDFESLLTLLEEVQKERKISLEIIGEGDLKSWLLEKLNRRKIDYRFHGSTFDEDVKRAVISKSWFGYNGFKANTEVALSYKTIDYFSFGVPILNSTKGDSYTLVEKLNAGINFSPTKLDELIAQLKRISKKEINEYKKNTVTVFNEKFSGASFLLEMDELLNKMEDKKQQHDKSLTPC